MVEYRRAGKNSCNFLELIGIKEVVFALGFQGWTRFEHRTFSPPSRNIMGQDAEVEGCIWSPRWVGGRSISKELGFGTPG